MGGSLEGGRTRLQCHTAWQHWLFATLFDVRARQQATIDVLVGGEESSCHGWVQQYQRRLHDAYAKAATQLNHHADQRKARHDRDMSFHSPPGSACISASTECSGALRSTMCGRPLPTVSCCVKGRTTSTWSSPPTGSDNSTR